MNPAENPLHDENDVAARHPTDYSPTLDQISTVEGASFELEVPGSDE